MNYPIIIVYLELVRNNNGNWIIVYNWYMQNIKNFNNENNGDIKIYENKESQ